MDLSIFFSVWEGRSSCLDEVIVMAADLITHTEKLPSMALWGMFVFVKMHVC